MLDAARLTVTYRIRGDAASIEARAASIAVEQSVEMPVDAIGDAHVRAEIVGRVETIEDVGGGRFDVRISLSTATTGCEAGQLLNMLFGNSSIHDDVELIDADFPADLAAAFPGPRHGLDGMRAKAGTVRQALTCSALKPQGMSPRGLADLAYRLALGRLDVIKDDHGLADQAFSRFADRVPACADAVARANAETGGTTRYFPNLSGNLDQLRHQTRIVEENGLDGVLVAPMLVGLPSVVTLVREHPDISFMAHPAMAGAARIAPPFLLGRLFRLMGADVTVFPNHGGRFGYSTETCRSLARAALAPWEAVKPCLPAAAGGMTLERVPEMLDFYGPDIMLLIGGGLLAARGGLTETTARFVAAVEEHSR